MDADATWSFATFALTLGGLLGTILLRKRILAALGRLLFTKAIEFVRATYFVEVSVDTDDGPVKRLVPSAALQSLSASVLPMLVQTALKSIKVKAGGTLPINPATGQLDFMMPVMAKVAAGKKVGLEDFLPLIMDKAMPFVEQMLGGLGKGTPGGKPAGKETPNPFAKELAP